MPLFSEYVSMSEDHLEHVYSYLLEELNCRVRPVVVAARELAKETERWDRVGIASAVPHVSNPHRCLVALFDPGKRQAHGPSECPLRAHHLLHPTFRWQALYDATDAVIQASHQVAMHYGWAGAIYASTPLPYMQGLPPIPSKLPARLNKAADNLESHIRKWSDGVRRRWAPRVDAITRRELGESAEHHRICPPAYPRDDASDLGQKPKEYLWSWREILDALGLKNDQQFQRLVRNLNEEHEGPIILPNRRGAQARVNKAKLLDWWDRLEILWETGGGGANTAATVANQHLYGRNGTVVPGIAGHVAARKKKGGK
jgi:hypothetical protein